MCNRPATLSYYVSLTIFSSHLVTFESICELLPSMDVEPYSLGTIQGHRRQKFTNWFKGDQGDEKIVSDILCSTRGCLVCYKEMCHFFVTDWPPFRATKLVIHRTPRPVITFKPIFEFFLFASVESCT